MFSLEEHMSYLYKGVWGDIYNHIQDVLFFTRAELYPTNLSTKEMLILQMSWFSVDKKWHHSEFITPFMSLFHHKWFGLFLR